MCLLQWSGKQLCVQISALCSFPQIVLSRGLSTLYLGPFTGYVVVRVSFWCGPQSGLNRQIMRATAPAQQQEAACGGQGQKADSPQAAPLPLRSSLTYWLFYWEPQSISTSLNLRLGSVHLSIIATERHLCNYLHIWLPVPHPPLTLDPSRGALHLLWACAPLVVAVQWVPVE